QVVVHLGERIPGEVDQSGAADAGHDVLAHVHLAVAAGLGRGPRPGQPAVEEVLANGELRRGLVAALPVGLHLGHGGFSSRLGVEPTAEDLAPAAVGAPPHADAEGPTELGAIALGVGAAALWDPSSALAAALVDRAGHGRP